MNIPEELWDTIFAEIPKDGLATLLRVSRKWRALTYPRVFRTLSLTFNPTLEHRRARSRDMLHAVLNDAPLCGVVRELTVTQGPASQGPASREDMVLVAEALQHLRALTAFEYRCGNEPGFPFVFDALSTHNLALEKLTIAIRAQQTAETDLFAHIRIPTLKFLTLRLLPGTECARLFACLAHHPTLTQLTVETPPDGGLPLWTPTYTATLAALQHLTLSLKDQALRTPSPVFPAHLLSLTLTISESTPESAVRAFFARHAPAAPSGLECFSLKCFLQRVEVYGEIAAFVRACVHLRRLFLNVTANMTRIRGYADAYRVARQVLHGAIVELTCLEVLVVRSVPFDQLQTAALISQLGPSIRLVALANLKERATGAETRDLGALLPRRNTLHDSNDHETAQRYAMLFQKPHLRALKALILLSIPRVMRTDAASEEAALGMLTVLPYLHFVASEEDNIFAVHRNSEGRSTGQLSLVSRSQRNSKNEFQLTDMEWYLSRPIF